MSKVTNEEFLKMLEEKDGFNVHKDDGVVEIETWTDGGVNMFVTLHENNGDFITQLEEYIENFDIDEEIDIHRQDEKYRADFAITESVRDFKNYIDWLDAVCDELKGEEYPISIEKTPVHFIFTVDEWKTHSSRHLVGASDNEGLIVKSIEELIENKVIGEDDKKYNVQQLFDTGRLNDIQYLLVVKGLLNDIQTDGGYI